MRREAAVILIAVALFAACSSPEASRQPGQPGADPGNRPAVVDMHGRTDPAHDTPTVGKAADTQSKR